MVDDLVMRSVYLPPKHDSQLSQLAHELNVTKSELIRSAIGKQLKEWLASNSTELVLRDLDANRSDGKSASVPAIASPAVRASRGRGGKSASAHAATAAPPGAVGSKREPQTDQA